MEYKILGRTGLRVSKLGIGGHEYRRELHPRFFPKKSSKIVINSENQKFRNKLIEKAIQRGVNYFDTTLKREAKSLGAALNQLGKRKEVYIAAEKIFPFKDLEEKPKERWDDIIHSWIEERLNLLQTDYIDVYNLHMPEKNFTIGKLEKTIEVLNILKEENKINHIGASSHSPKFLSELIRKYDCFESVMVRYNYYLQDSKDVLFPICKAHNVGIVGMKPLAWPYYGIPFTHFVPDNQKESTLTPIQNNLKWIHKTDSISTVMIAVNNMEELVEDIEAFEKKGEIDEGVLKETQEYALSEKGKDKLKELKNNSKKDIRNFAKKILNPIDSELSGKNWG